MLHLYTDSSSSVLALKRTFPSNVIVLRIFRLLIDHLHKILHIGWVKAHIGIHGNERADSLAKQVILAGIYDEEVELPFPPSAVRLHFNRQIHVEWQLEWSNGQTGRKTYAIIKNVRADFVCRGQVLLYFVTGHGSFPAYLFQIGKRTNDLCDCGHRGDVVHYIFGRCRFMNHYFLFNNHYTVRQNLFRILFEPANYRKHCDNYNVLNQMYSFIRYRF